MRKRLEQLLLRIRQLKRELAGVPASLGAASPFERKLQELDELVEEAQDFEGKLYAAEVGGVLAAETAGRRSAEARALAEAIREVGETQLEVAQRIEAVAARAVARVARVASAGADELEREIRTTMAALGVRLDAEIGQAVVTVGGQAVLRSRELAIRIFGREIIARAKEIGVVFTRGVDQALVDEIWNRQPGTLRWLIQSSNRRNADRLAAEVRGLISAGRDARRTFGELELLGYPEARMSRWARDLVEAARRASQSREAVEAYRVAARRARAYVRDLKPGKVGTRGAGKQLLARLEKAVREGSEEAIQRAANEWIRRKTAYEAIRTMRTATNETYRRMTNQDALTKPWIYAMRRVLSASHPRMDYCEAVAMADMGLGPGVYAIGQLPQEHSNGLCRDEPVWDRDYFRNDGRPLVWTPRPGYEQAVRDLSYGGAFAKEAARMKSREDLERLMAKRGYTGRAERPLRRVDREEAAGDNIARRRPAA